MYTIYKTRALNKKLTVGWLLDSNNYNVYSWWWYKFQGLREHRIYWPTLNGFIKIKKVQTIPDFHVWYVNKYFVELL